MELGGHNILHGQWDWMNDPDVHSSVWDWDTASTAKAWKHSHNYVHHTYTNILGKDRDLGYEIMRIDPNQPWHPVWLAQPLFNFLLMMLFEWGGVAVHDIDFRAAQRGEKPWSEVRSELKGISGKARAQIVKDYLGWPAISAGAFALAQIATRGRLEQPKHSRVGRRLRQLSAGRMGSAASLLDRVLPGVESTFMRTLGADMLANLIRNVWAHSIIFCGHFPDQTYTFTEEEVANETRGGWYVRQLIGAANIEGGSPLFHLVSGNLAIRSNTICSPPTCPAAGTPRSLRRSRTSASVTSCHTTRAGSPSSCSRCTAPSFVCRSPAEKTPAQARTVPSDRAQSPKGPSEATRFRERVPAEHPDAGPEHESGGVAVQPPPRGRD